MKYYIGRIRLGLCEKEILTNGVFAIGDKENPQEAYEKLFLDAEKEANEDGDYFVKRNGFKEISKETYEEIRNFIGYL